MEAAESPAPDLRYPIGRYGPPATIGAAQVAEWIAAIEQLPAALRTTVEPLNAAQRATPYRPGGWTVHQVVHHVADSHLNSYVRFRWALTEERPTIKDYDEKSWAELPDVAELPLEVSLDLLAGLHRRWTALLRLLTPAQLARELVHPQGGPIALDANIGLYAWHGAHHLAHIQRLIQREGW